MLFLLGFADGGIVYHEAHEDTQKGQVKSVLTIEGTEDTTRPSGGFAACSGRMR